MGRGAPDNQLTTSPAAPVTGRVSRFPLHERVSWPRQIKAAGGTGTSRKPLPAHFSESSLPSFWLAAQAGYDTQLLLEHDWAQWEVNDCVRASWPFETGGEGTGRWAPEGEMRASGFLGSPACRALATLDRTPAAQDSPLPPVSKRTGTLWAERRCDPSPGSWFDCGLRVTCSKHQGVHRSLPELPQLSSKHRLVGDGAANKPG